MQAAELRHLVFGSGGVALLEINSGETKVRLGGEDRVFFDGEQARPGGLRRRQVVLKRGRLVACSNCGLRNEKAYSAVAAMTTE